MNGVVHDRTTLPESFKSVIVDMQRQFKIN
jgi:hypothetical protein